MFQNKLFRFLQAVGKMKFAQRWQCAPTYKGHRDKLHVNSCLQCVHVANRSARHNHIMKCLFEGPVNIK